MASGVPSAAVRIPSRPTLRPAVPLRDAEGGIGFDLNITLLDAVDLQGSVTLDPTDNALTDQLERGRPSCPT